MRAPAAFPSMLLGAANLNPLQVAQMYNTLANGGFRSPLWAVPSVIDEHGKPLMPESMEDRWIDYYTGKEVSPYCTSVAVSLPFAVGTTLEPSDTCPPGLTPEEAAALAPAGGTPELPLAP